MKSWTDFHAERRANRGARITASDVSAAVARFRLSGGVIRRLADERVAPVSMRDGAAGLRGCFEDVRSRTARSFSEEGGL